MPQMVVPSPSPPAAAVATEASNMDESASLSSTSASAASAGSAEQDSDAEDDPGQLLNMWLGELNTLKKVRLETQPFLPRPFALSPSQKSVASYSVFPKKEEEKPLLLLF